METLTHPDSIASTQEHDRARLLKTFQHYLGEDVIIHDRLTSGDPINVLSVGCGHADEVKPFLDLSPHITWQGIDVDPHQIENARLFNRDVFDDLLLSKRAHIEQADVMTFTPQSHIDIVVVRHPPMRGTMSQYKLTQTVGNFNAELTAAWNVVKQGGTMMVTTEDQAFLKEVNTLLSRKGMVVQTSERNQFLSAYRETLGDQYVLVGHKRKRPSKLSRMLQFIK